MKRQGETEEVQTKGERGKADITTHTHNTHVEVVGQ